ncbi:hypothetical protein ALC57_04326 [Trachymyrmex cornetzi]|uniref:Uncharacterized protein n=1 Tax=Trachymyrmex cornetzi TaxID=471704 RepID=A0A195EF68_9HYME|nr:hypothetical protein ALC57_04326 [Trachymyrmex cornetzi]
MPRGLSNVSLCKQAGKNSGRAMTNNTYIPQARKHKRNGTVNRSYFEFLGTAIIGDSFLQDFSDREGDTICTWVSLSSAGNVWRGAWFPKAWPLICLLSKYSNNDTHICGQRPFIGRFFFPFIIRFSSLRSMLHLHRPYKNIMHAVSADREVRCSRFRRDQESHSDPFPHNMFPKSTLIPIDIS